MRAVVTGAGPASIGLATARALADLGHEVLVSTRSTPVPGFEHHPLDLADSRSVAAFASWVIAQGDLDVLINNAGVHLDLRKQWSAPQLADGHEIHWRTNYLGTVQLTRALLPSLLARAEVTGDVRVVHLVSLLHNRGTSESLVDGPQPYDSWAAYGTSKLALVHDAASLSERYGDRGLRAYAVHPGAVYTRIADRGLEGSPLLGRLRRLAAPVEKLVLKTPEQGAATTVVCATGPHPVPGYWANSKPAVPSPAAGDTAARAALWERTTAWLDQP